MVDRVTKRARGRSTRRGSHCYCHACEYAKSSVNFRGFTDEEGEAAAAAAAAAVATATATATIAAAAATVTRIVGFASSSSGLLVA